MCYLWKYLTDPTFRQSEWAWRTYHDSERACRVLCKQGSGSFVLILRERLSELLIEYPVPEGLAKTALTFHESLKELSEPIDIVEKSAL